MESAFSNNHKRAWLNTRMEGRYTTERKGAGGWIDGWVSGGHIETVKEIDG